MTRVRRQSGGMYPTNGYITRVNSSLPALNYTINQSITRDIELNVCEDSLGRDSVHPLKITKLKRVISPCNGKLKTGNNEYTVNNFFANNATQLDRDTIHEPIALLDVAAATSKLLARTNPNRVASSIPQFIGELKDVPNMFRLQASNLAATRPKKFGSTVGGAYLQWKFGWEPLIRDIQNFLDGQRLVDQRVKELQNLYKNGGISRRLNLASGSAGYEDVLSILSFPSSTILYGKMSRITKGRQWGTVRWIPTAIPTDLSNESLRKLARDAVFGLGGVHISDVWELLPWSWMVDWCSNIGDWLQAKRNKIPVVPRDICIMQYRETKTTWSRTDQNLWVSGGDGTCILETKERFLGSGSLSASIPFLNGGQLSILGALAATRR